METKDISEFYPTPKSLLEEILEGLDWRKVTTVLEPSAGKGDIALYIKEKADAYPYYNSRLDIDCIEIDDALRKTLRGAELKVVHDDFLTFRTFKKYSLIVMNPPFSEGDRHLKKALEMQARTGGDVICILNAETIRNPYTNLRKELVHELEETGAVIEYKTHAFSSAERETDVEIAVVKAHYEAPEEISGFFEGLKKKAYEETGYTENMTELAPSDFIEAIIKSYEIEVEAGLKLIREYKGMLPHLMPNIKAEKNAYSNPIIELKTDGLGLSENKYVERVRIKYWNALFTDSRITGKMTSNLSQQFLNKVNELKDYDFSMFNIRHMQALMSRELIHGIEECIIKLFDELSHKYSYIGETSNNIHYYNGWKTNEAWKVNKKVIIPFYSAFGRYGIREGDSNPTNYDCYQKLSDIEKALNYLDGGKTWNLNLHSCLAAAERDGRNKNIVTKYFTMTFYKKGTCHLIFRDEELLKKFNIFGSQMKGWLPPAYGKKKYAEMDEAERTVVDEFEGEASYSETLANSDYYLFDAANILAIEDHEAA